jgi:hypothetical protein
MNLTVVWEPSAEQELARLWSEAPDPGRVQAAADQIDYLLSADPLGVGESRTELLRILHILPLGVVYEVDQPAGRVEVRKVWRPRRRRR